MLKKFTLSAAAIAAVGVAAPAMSAETVDIDVVVQSVSFLEVPAGESTGNMTIDSSDESFMGTPSSDGDNFDNGDSHLAVVKLSTNVDVDGIDINFPRTNGIKNFSSATYFGQAIGDSSGNTLGVWPQAGGMGSANGVIGDNTAGKGSGQCAWGHDGSNTSLEAMGPCRESGATGFGNGEHYVGIGVSTNWDRTLTGEPMFAVPDIYEIQMSATIIPSP